VQNPETTTTRLEFWRNAEGLTYDALGECLGVSLQSALRYCLPADHKHARRPSTGPGRKLSALTKGAIHSDNAADIVDLETGDLIDAKPQADAA